MNKEQPASHLDLVRRLVDALDSEHFNRFPGPPDKAILALLAEARRALREFREVKT